MVLGMLLLLVGGASGQSQIDLDVPFDVNEVKAEFLERITRFVKWPEGHWLDPATPFQIGVWGECQMSEVLARRSRKWTIQGRQVELRQVAEGEDLSQVDVLFIAATEAENLERLLEQTAMLPILTVADTTGFGARGVLINFFVSDESVRFEINQQAAVKSGLGLSSRLLKIAHLIGTKGAPIGTKGAEPRPTPQT